MISPDEKTALGHARIVEFHKFVSEFQIWLESEEERFRIRIRVYATADGRFFFVQSHFVKTPISDAPFPSTNLTYDTAHLALGSAVQSITTYYDDAIAKGHKPSSDWFVLNDVF